MRQEHRCLGKKSNHLRPPPFNFSKSQVDFKLFKLDYQNNN